ncbi:MAG: hypothetical protein IJ106_16230 [Parasporobacterium sp.]|nr:hypothetical protein [Parasporobacterium sp.]MBQ9032974.1 hypothetical protein [Parasporobacterium sp.]
MDKVNGGMDFTAPPKAGRHPPRVQKTPFFAPNAIFAEDQVWKVKDFFTADLPFAGH